MKTFIVTINDSKTLTKDVKAIAYYFDVNGNLPSELSNFLEKNGKTKEKLIAALRKNHMTHKEKQNYSGSVLEYADLLPRELANMLLEIGINKDEVKDFILTSDHFPKALVDFDFETRK